MLLEWFGIYFVCVSFFFHFFLVCAITCYEGLRKHVNAGVLVGSAGMGEEIGKISDLLQGEKEPAIKSFLKIVISRLTFFWDCVFVVFYEVE